MKKYNFILLVTMTFGLYSMKRVHEDNDIFFKWLLPELIEKIFSGVLANKNGPLSQCNIEVPLNEDGRLTLIQFVRLRLVSKKWYDFISKNQRYFNLSKQAKVENERFFVASYDDLYKTDEESNDSEKSTQKKKVVQRNEKKKRAQLINNIINSNVFEKNYYLPNSNEENLSSSLLVSSIMFNADVDFLKELSGNKNICFDKLCIKDKIQIDFFGYIIRNGNFYFPDFFKILPFFKIDTINIATAFFSCIIKRAKMYNQKFFEFEDNRLYNYASSLIEAKANLSFFKTEASTEQVQELKQKDFPKLKGLCEQLIKN
jgi:hypothetical protein